MAHQRLSMNGLCAPWARQQHLARYRWAAKFTIGAIVLDAACGTGYGAAIIASKGSARQVVGVDCDQRTVDEARRVYRSLANVSFETGNVEHLPFPDETFDIYLSFETIEHVDNPSTLLQEAHRVLRPGGRFAVSTLNRTLTNPGTQMTDKPYITAHVREWSFEDFAELIRTVFNDTELFIQAPFSARYSARLRLVSRVSRRLAVRTHQTSKLALTLLRRFPSCDVQPHRPGVVGEVSVLVAVK